MGIARRDELTLASLSAGTAAPVGHSWCDGAGLVIAPTDLDLVSARLWSLGLCIQDSGWWCGAF